MAATGAAGAAGQPRPVMTGGGHVNEAGNNRSVRPVGARVFKIDVSHQVAEIEGVLRAGGLLRSGGDCLQYVEALAIVRRWQFDEMLDDASREKARVLVRTFAADGWDEVRRR